MAECRGVEYILTVDYDSDLLGENIHSSDWFDSDNPRERAAAITKFIQKLFPGDLKKKPCIGGCDDPKRECIPCSMFIGLKEDVGWFEIASEEVDGALYESYLLVIEGRGQVDVRTWCSCVGKKIRWL